MIIMKLSDKNLCGGTGHYFSLFWAMECPNGIGCYGCQGCGWDLFVEMWRVIGRACIPKIVN